MGGGGEVVEVRVGHVEPAVVEGQAVRVAQAGVQNDRLVRTVQQGLDDLRTLAPVPVKQKPAMSKVWFV